MQYIFPSHADVYAMYVHIPPYSCKINVSNKLKYIIKTCIINTVGLSIVD
jgi:hypothetical protein